MEDIERYGDYDNIEDEASGGSSIVLKLLKALVILVCLFVVGILAFRVILFYYYPSSMKEIYFNDTLTEHYNEKGGEVAYLTQTLRAPYDDPDTGSFFADNLIVIEDAGQLQLSVRYNKSVFDMIYKEYGVEIDPSTEGLLSFRLERVPFGEGAVLYEVGDLSHEEEDKLLMYTYHKLVFDGIEFTEEGEHDWLRLVITVNGHDEIKPFYILVYEKTDTYDKFEEYKPSKGERP